MDANDWLMQGGKTPGISWRNRQVGFSVTGTICRESKVMQQRDPEDNELLWWDEAKTRPKEQLVVYIQTTERDPSIEDDDGIRALYVKGRSLTEQTREAVRRSGRKGLEIGGVLTVTFVGEGEQKNKVFNPPKLFRVTYQPPADSASTSFLGKDDPAPQNVYPGASNSAAYPAPQNVYPGASNSAAYLAAGGFPQGVDKTAWDGLPEALRAQILAQMGGSPVGANSAPPF